MRTFTLLFSALVLGTTAQAQTVATFDDLSLPSADTYYVNYSAFGTNVGFSDGLAFFPCVYDTSGGYTFWNYFAYSDKNDSVTSGFGNQYAAKTGKGYGGSAKYAVAFCSNPVTYEFNMNLILSGGAVGQPVNGFYVTNSTYTYNAIAQGYPLEYPARKFHSGDWLLLTIKGYVAGVLSADSVNFYLADYRFSDTDSNYIVKTWEWVNLLPLGHVDSLQFSMNSSDTGSFGMNSPSYFCMDNFTTNQSDVAVKNVQTAFAAKVYPNPAVNALYVDLTDDNTVQQVQVIDMAGNVMSAYNVSSSHIEINTANFVAGTYILQLAGNGKNAQTKFVKE